MVLSVMVLLSTMENSVTGKLFAFMVKEQLTTLVHAMATMVHAVATMVHAVATMVGHSLLTDWPEAHQGLGNQG